LDLRGPILWHGFPESCFRSTLKSCLGSQFDTDPNRVKLFNFQQDVGRKASNLQGCDGHGTSRSVSTNVHFIRTLRQEGVMGMENLVVVPHLWCKFANSCFWYFQRGVLPQIPTGQQRPKCYNTSPIQVTRGPRVIAIRCDAERVSPVRHPGPSYGTAQPNRASNSLSSIPMKAQASRTFGQCRPAAPRPCFHIWHILLTATETTHSSLLLERALHAFGIAARSSKVVFRDSMDWKTSKCFSQTLPRPYINASRDDVFSKTG
jgi:hypothetical protein